MRLFLALELSAPVLRYLDRLQDRLRREGDGWRWSATPSIHLTLRFLGEVPEPRDLAARKSWRSVAARNPAFRISIGSVGCFPTRGLPRILWVGLQAEQPVGALDRLAADLEQAARREGFEAETRRFRPHLTLARARKGKAARKPPVEESEAAPWIEAQQLVLFESRLEPGGARYTAVERYALGSD